MNLKQMLTAVSMAAVLLITACVSVRVFISLEPPVGSEPTTEAPTAYGTVVDEAALEASRIAAQAVYEQASRAGNAALAQAELTKEQQQDSIASQFKDADKLYDYVDDAIESGELTYDKLYEDTLIVGDYPIATVQLYGYLSERHCMGRTDADLTFLQDNIITLTARAPKTLILHFGMNDLPDDVLALHEQFIYPYERICKRLQQLLPGTKLVISSVFPVTETAAQNNPKYQNISLCNAYLIAMCTDNGWLYLDNDSVVATHANYFGSGGVYLTGEFYEQFWLKHAYAYSRGLAKDSLPY